MEIQKSERRNSEYELFESQRELETQRLKLPKLTSFMEGTFTWGIHNSPRNLGLRQRDQSCHHEVWLHLDFVGDRYAHGSRKNHDHRVHLKDKSWPCPPTKERGRYDDGSDYSLSS